MSDKITYSFDDMLSQVQVYKHGLLSYFAHAFLNKLVCGQSCLWVCVLSVCLSVFMAVCVFQRNKSALVPANQSADDIHTEQACGNIDAETCESTL